MFAGDVAGDVGEVMAVALVGIGVLIGKKYGAKAAKKFNRIVSRAVLAWLAVAVIIGLIYWAIASAG